MRKIDTIAHRIKIVRKEHNLTSEQFAERIMCNKRTIQRYENGDSLPDIYNLKRISIEFGVSTDYLLGLSDQMDTTYHAEEIALLYKKYKQMMLNPIKKGEDYYWIRMEVKEDKTYITSLQTEWLGFADEDANNIKEIRRARKVIPANVIKLCEQINRKPVIINKISEIDVFYLFGGEAIIREKLCKEKMKNILEPIIVDVPKY